MTDLDIANVSAEDDLRVGALADGLATSAVNGTHADDGSIATAGVGNDVNTNTTNNTTNTDSSNSDNDLNSHNDNNGDNRGNDYDWDYNSKVVNATHTETDTDIKDNGNTLTSNSNNDLNSHNDYDWTSNKSFSNTDTDVKNITKNEMDDSNNTTTNSHNTSVTDDDFGSLKDVFNSGNLGVAGHDLTYNIGDDYSFHFNIDNVLNNSLGGDGNDVGFSLPQINNLADQDVAYDLKMNNAGANNTLSANGGEAHTGDGVDIDSKLSWDPHTAGVGHDMTGNSTADASAILANSGFHQELVQGANMVSNAADIAITGGHDSHDTHTGG
jgi:hypothetical protein